MIGQENVVSCMNHKGRRMKSVVGLWLVKGKVVSRINRKASVGKVGPGIK